MRTKEEITAYKKAWYIKNKAKHSAAGKEWRERNKEAHIAYQRQYNIDHPNRKKKWYSVNKEHAKAYRQANKERDSAKRKEYKQANKDRILAANKEYYEKNKNKVLQANKKWRKAKAETSPSYKMQIILRERVRGLISKGRMGYKKHSTSQLYRKLLGCSISDFMVYMETNMAYGMNWDNYGFRGWHIDHIKPCAAFDLTDDKQVAECFHYTNMQPLWWRDNISKGAKYQHDGGHQ